VLAGRLDPDAQIVYLVEPGRGVWVQVAGGAVKVNGERLEDGDGAALEGESKLLIEGVERGEVLVFDLQ
jgi:redox-sensitive bicupin YhaK (pirin superfamily)